MEYMPKKGNKKDLTSTFIPKTIHIPYQSFVKSIVWLLGDYYYICTTASIFGLFAQRCMVYGVKVFLPIEKYAFVASFF